MPSIAEFDSLLAGTFTHLEDHDYQGPTPHEVLSAWATRLRVPLIARLPFGHMEDALVLPYKRMMQMQAGRNGTWTVAIRAAGK